MDTGFDEDDSWDDDDDWKRKKREVKINEAMTKAKRELRWEILQHRLGQSPQPDVPLSQYLCLWWL